MTNLEKIVYLELMLPNNVQIYYPDNINDTLYEFVDNFCITRILNIEEAFEYITNNILPEFYYDPI